MDDQTWKKTPKLHLAVSGRKWARVAHLQRHLSANRIKVSRFSVNLHTTPDLLSHYQK